MDSETMYCRLCAELQPSSRLLNFQEDDNKRKELIKKLNRLNTPIEIFQEKLPKTVCIVCLSRLDSAYIFVKKVSHAQEILYSKLVQGTIDVTDDLILESPLDSATISNEIDVKSDNIGILSESNSNSIGSPETGKSNWDGETDPDEENGDMKDNEPLIFLPKGENDSIQGVSKIDNLNDEPTFDPLTVPKIENDVAKKNSNQILYNFVPYNLLQPISAKVSETSTKVTIYKNSSKGIMSQKANFDTNITQKMSDENVVIKEETNLHNEPQVEIENLMHESLNKSHNTDNVAKESVSDNFTHECPADTLFTNNKNMPAAFSNNATSTPKCVADLPSHSQSNDIEVVTNSTNHNTISDHDYLVTAKHDAAIKDVHQILNSEPPPLIPISTSKDSIDTKSKENETDFVNSFDVSTSFEDSDHSNLEQEDKRQSQKGNAWENYTWLCIFCKYQFPTVDELQKHSIQDHQCCNPYRCMDCAKIQWQKWKVQLDKYVEHVRRHRSHLKLSCYQCPETFTTPRAIIDHEKTHKTSKWSCPGCNTSFLSLDELNNHTEKYYIINKVAENMICCNTNFRNKYVLHMHTERIHKREKDFICHVCGKSFPFHYLKSHLLVHTESRPFKCEICNHAFKNISFLKKHIRQIHESLKTFICDACGRGFPNKNGLRNHIVMHDDSLRYVCSVCSKGFRRKRALKGHMLQHTGEKPYSCSECGRVFTNWANCLKHMKRRHNNNMDLRKKVEASSAPSKDFAEWKKEILNTKARKKNKKPAMGAL